MDRLRRIALLTVLAEKLAQRGSWCGETHLQKAVYVAQEAFDVPFGLEFILYRHGPFSFDLRDELTSLRADGLLKLVPQRPPYGARMAVTERSKGIRARFLETTARFEQRLDEASRAIGSRGVAALERLATALWVTREMGDGATNDDRAQRLVDLKPHVSIEAARRAVEQIDDLNSPSADLTSRA